MVLKAIPQGSVAETIAAEIRESIQAGELKPGDKLVERSLSTMLGVSHIPVREALARLAEEGLVERTPRRVARVAILSKRDLDEISSLRIVLESFVARLVQSRWSPSIESELRAIAGRMAVAAGAGDAAEMFQLDREFHQALWEMADHRTLMTVATQLRRRIDGFIREANRSLSPAELVRHADSHLEIIDVLASRDPSVVDSAVSAHITAAMQRMDDSHR